jgi:hypothetical protein
MTWKLILISLTALISGCAKAIEGNYCDLARVKHFESADTINWLSDNDRVLLAQIVAENEIYMWMCR